MPKSRKSRKRKAKLRAKTSLQHEAVNHYRLSDLMEVIDGDSVNLKASLFYLGKLGIMAQYEQMFLLYDKLFKFINEYYNECKVLPLIRNNQDGSQSPAWDFILKEVMLLSARQQLIFAAGHLFRTHTSEVFGHVRRSIEGAGIAYLSKSDRDLGEIFIQNDRKEFSRRTQKDKILPEGNPITNDLRESMDFSNSFVHNNFISMAARLKHISEAKDDRFTFTMKAFYHEVDQQNPGPFVNISLWLLRVGERVARLFASSFDLPEGSRWHQHLNEYKQSLDKLYADLDGLIRPK